MDEKNRLEDWDLAGARASRLEKKECRLVSKGGSEEKTRNQHHVPAIDEIHAAG